MRQMVARMFTLVRRPWSVLSLWRPGLTAAGLLVLLVLSFCWGRYCTQPVVVAQDSLSQSLDDGPYSKRPVAYIYGTQAITREELGEYLIARLGVQRVEFLVNRRIIEAACQAKGIVVSDQDVEEQFKREMLAIGKHVTADDFEKQILTRVNKSMYEWKEDVLRPKIAMTRLCQDRIVVLPEELTRAFEAKYGPKVQCRMIVLEEKNPQRFDIQQEARQSEEKFLEYARQGIIPAIAAQGGRVPPIHKHFGDANVERVAFSLKKGEVSELMQMPDKTWIILKCDELIPATNANMSAERLTLHKEVFDRKLQEEIPRVFQELRRQAGPFICLKDQPRTTALPRTTSR